MRTFSKGIGALSVALALIAVAQSCATLGPGRIEMPCDERVEALLSPARTGEGIEIVGKLRLDLPRYRIRGLMRIAYFPGDGVARIDFRHSSLFGALEAEMTILVGDSLVIYDRENGKRLGNDSSLALMRDEAGGDVAPDDILIALLLESPRCAEMRSASVTRSGESWRLKGDWRGRRIEMVGENGRGTREFKQCFAAGTGGCYTISYGRPMVASDLVYPRWIRLRKDIGNEKAIFELVAIKALTESHVMSEMDAIKDQ